MQKYWKLFLRFSIIGWGKICILKYLAKGRYLLCRKCLSNLVTTRERENINSNRAKAKINFFGTNKCYNLYFMAKDVGFQVHLYFRGPKINQNWHLFCKVLFFSFRISIFKSSIFKLWWKKRLSDNLMLLKLLKAVLCMFCRNGR